MPESPLANALKDQIRELEKMQKQHEKQSERIAAMIEELQAKVTTYEKKRER